MAAFPQRLFRHKLTWWQRTGVTGGGDPNFIAPVVINGFWQGRSEEFRSPDGETLVSRGTAMVDADVHVGDYLLFGTSVVVSPFDAGALRVAGEAIGYGVTSGSAHQVWMV
jgi:hypothetical protein